MRKKTIAHKPPREKVYKLPSKPSTRSQDRTFTPSPSPPTSPPRTAPMARTKTTPRYPTPAKPTPPPKATSSKPSSSKPGSSKGKRPTVEEPVPETTKPKPKSVPVRSQRGARATQNTHRIHCLVPPSAAQRLSPRPSAIEAHPTPQVPTPALPTPHSGSGSRHSHGAGQSGDLDLIFSPHGLLRVSWHTPRITDSSLSHLFTTLCVHPSHRRSSSFDGR
ncbi:extensin-like [Arachis ipaensis]|uniref:extensin-like n=1 Tax=Arachis ipaensis TaxID=130454 RepID=UPI0007AFC362|nr:extensin-like [Arachis ipaensis]